VRLAFISLGAWETHVNQGSISGQLANHLKPLGDGLADFAKRLGPAYDDKVILVLSEFGRTVRENGSGGTDHGYGNVMWRWVAPCVPAASMADGQACRPVNAIWQ
jgi:uncharacterized protein (DUF1501 family)